MIPPNELLQKHTADIIPIVTHRLVNKYELANLRIDTYMDTLLNAMCVELVAYIVAMPEQRIDIKHRWPADWWQAFRKRWFPRWWLKRWPVQYKRVSVHQTIYSKVCPHIKIPEQTRHLEWLSRDKEKNDLPTSPPSEQPS